MTIQKTLLGSEMFYKHSYIGYNLYIFLSIIFWLQFRIFLAAFVVMAAPFGFFNVTKTKYLQILTSLMRWLAFSAMVTLACIRLGNGNIHHPRSVNVDGIPNMFGVCVYSFMCHHSLPSLGN